MITEDQALTKLGDFFSVVVPGVPAVIGQTNRVPPPADQNHIVMWPIMRERLETNRTGFIDALFTGSITDDTLDITHVFYGSLEVGSVLLGDGIAANTTITEILTGTGGEGTYTVSVSQTVTSQDIAAGIRQDTAPTKLTVQADVHGPLSADNAQRIMTVFRSDYAIDLMDNVVPLYSSDPRQAPYLNAEQQIENRWSIDLVMQINPLVETPQQFFGEAEVTTKPPADVTNL